jgi:hypothetical protein
MASAPRPGPEVSRTRPAIASRLSGGANRNSTPYPLYGQPTSLASRTTRPRARRKGPRLGSANSSSTSGRPGRAVELARSMPLTLMLQVRPENWPASEAFGFPITWPRTGTRAPTRRGTARSFATEASTRCCWSGRRRMILAPAATASAATSSGSDVGISTRIDTARSPGDERMRATSSARAMSGSRGPSTTRLEPFSASAASSPRPVGCSSMTCPPRCKRGVSSRRLRPSRPATSTGGSIRAPLAVSVNGSVVAGNRRAERP